MLRRAVGLAVVLCVVPAAPALADDAIAELGREGRVAGYGGWSAWSSYDGVSARYALTLRDPSGTVKAAAIATANRPFDVALGPDADGNVVAIYQRCLARGCDLRRYSTASGRDVKLAAVSSPSYNEATPAIWRTTVVFTRRIRGCDVPFVKDLASSAGSRRLLRRKCVQTEPGQASIRGVRIVISSVDRSGADAHGAGFKVAELREYSSRRSGSNQLLRQSFGEESNLFGQVAQDARYAYTVRYGVHPANTFVRVPFAGGVRDEVGAARSLTAAFAKPTSATSLYVEAQGGEETGCDGFAEIPCRLVRAPASLFAGGRRVLTPQLTVGYGGTPRRGLPLAFSGVLSRTAISGGDALSVEALAGVTVELLHRTGANPERFEPTGLRAATDADGRYQIVVPAVGDDPWYTAVAATPGIATWAGRGTVGSVAR